MRIISNTKTLSAIKKIISGKLDVNLTARGKDPINVVKFGINKIILDKPTYKQLMELRDKVIYKNEELKPLYFKLVNDMMYDIAQGKPNKTLKEYLIKYTLPSHK